VGVSGFQYAASHALSALVPFAKTSHMVIRNLLSDKALAEPAKRWEIKSETGTNAKEANMPKTLLVGGTKAQRRYLTTTEWNDGFLGPIILLLYKVTKRLFTPLLPAESIREIDHRRGFLQPFSLSQPSFLRSSFLSRLPVRR
jgi:hypothetical protein